MSISESVNKCDTYILRVTDSDFSIYQGQKLYLFFLLGQEGQEHLFY